MARGSFGVWFSFFNGIGDMDGWMGLLVKRLYEVKGMGLDRRAFALVGFAFSDGVSGVSGGRGTNHTEIRWTSLGCETGLLSFVFSSSCVQMAVVRVFFCIKC